jgi:hypothetical protein
MWRSDATGTDQGVSPTGAWRNTVNVAFGARQTLEPASSTCKVAEAPGTTPAGGAPQCGNVAEESASPHAPPAASRIAIAATKRAADLRGRS